MTQIYLALSRKIFLIYRRNNVKAKTGRNISKHTRILCYNEIISIETPCMRCYSTVVGSLSFPHQKTNSYQYIILSI
jgi:hypothetical protein